MKKQFNFYKNDWSNNSNELLIDTLEFDSIIDAIEYMYENGYNRVEYAD